MAPQGAKRKRGYNNENSNNNSSNNDGSSRPSPYRPDALGLAQNAQFGQHQFNHNQNYPYNQNGGRGNRRGSGGGRGGSQRGSANGGYGYQDAGRQGYGREVFGSGPGHPNTSQTARQTRATSPRDISSTTALQPAVARATDAPATPLPPVASALTGSAQHLEPPKSVAPYDYEFLTEERLPVWADGGKASILAEAAQAYLTEDSFRLSIMFQELLRAGLDAKLDAVEAGKVVEEILSAAPEDTSINGPSLFLDVLSIITDDDVTNPRISPLVISTNISPALMREELDESMLQALNLVRNTFGKMFIRKQTGILYRQSNYNLLREETEGYSKLVTELFTTTDNEPPTAEVAGDTFENMKALIGAFDLDAGRVLDVTLDVFASLLVKHYRFFVKLLRCSSWWPQEQSLSGTNPQNQVFGGLPFWAQPDHSSWTTADDEREKMTALKEQRDKIFWERAREVGTDAFFELGGRRLASDDDVPETVQDVQSGDVRAAEITETRNWIKATRTLPPPGNSVAAQLLGFKLRFYSSEARDATDTLPVNLIYLAALLIKIGFISLRDLYPHLFPLDESMEGVKEKQKKEKEDRELAKRPGGGALNALARAGALADDTLPAPISRLRDVETRAGTPSKSDPINSKAGTPSVKAEEEEKEQLPEPSDQKVQLLRSLLCIGAIPEALYMLGRFSWLPDAFPDLPDYIHRILHYSLSKVYDPLCPLRDRDGVREAAKQPSMDQTGVPKGELRLLDAPPPKALRWAQLDKNDAHEAVDYRFYWDDWSDNVPICQNVDDVITLCNTFLNFSGVKIGLDTTLLMKIARIGKYSLTEDTSDANRSRWIDLCKRLLCPALSLTKSNPGVVNEVFDLLKLYPTQVRFSVYAEWFTGQTSRLPDIQAAFDLVRAETKDILKRMSKTNMKPMARTLAKTACASPGVAFSVVLNQIESYSNLIDVVVECGRYFTYMGYDILTWSLMNTLGRAGRSRVAQNGINTSSWLMSLSTFAGRIFKRYSVMNTLPILQYVLEQLHQDNTTDLRVLREIITTMAGIAPDTDFTDAQVQAMAGGELLQAQTLRQVHDKRHESKISAKRLTKTLVENGLTGPILISIAQQRQMCIFGPEVQLKIVSENYDDIHIVMTQFLDMIRNNLSIEDFESLIPNVISLISEYGIDPSVAFTIHRKSIARAIEQYDATHQPSNASAGRRRSTLTRVNSSMLVDSGESIATSGNGSTSAVEPNTILTPTAVRNDEDMVDTINSEAAEAAEEREAESDVDPSPWHPVLQSLMDKLQPTLPDEVQKSMSLPFFISFWQLSLHDLMAPYKSYTDEDNRQKERIAAINADRTDISVAGAKRKDLEKKAISDFQRRLVEEMKSHLANYSHVRERLEIEKKHWFKGFSGRWRILNDYILQDCFLPRLLISPLDSYFTWKILNMLHSSGTPEFRTMHFIDRLLGEKMLTNVIFQCTAREAENFGRFLNELLRELSVWHADRSVYEKRAFGTKKELPGFAQTITKEGTLDRFLDYEDFRRLLYKWHRNLFEALKSCIGNGEWKHVMNAIIVSRCVFRYFPAINWIGNGLYNSIETLAKSATEQHERPDLWVASNSLLGNLKGRQKDWMLPQAFYINDATTKQAKAPSRSTSTAPKTPHPEGASTPSLGIVRKPLSVSAPEFVPKALPSSINGEQKQNVTTKGEAESSDGEVEDVEMGNTRITPAPATSTPSTAMSKDQADLKSRALATIASNKRQLSATPSTNSQLASSVIVTASAPSPSVQGPQVGRNADLTVASQASTAESKDGHVTPGPDTSQPQPTAAERLDSTGSITTPRLQDASNHALPNRPQGPSNQGARYITRPESDHLSQPSSDRYDNRTNGVNNGAKLDRPHELMQQRLDDRRIQSPHHGEMTNHDFRGGFQDRFHDQQRPMDRLSRSGPPDQTARVPPRDSAGPPSEITPGRSPIDQYPRQDSRGFYSGRSDLGDQSRQVGSMQSQLSTSRPPETGVPINPARAALIAEPDMPSAASYDRESGPYREQDSRRDRFPRSHGQEFNDRRPNSNNMPPPNESIFHRVDLGPQRPPFDSRQMGREYSSEQTPTGPRSGPPPRNSFQNEDSSRRLDHKHSQQQPPGSAQSGLERTPGRISQDFSQQRGPASHYQDVNYGRLNADPVETPQLPPNQGQGRPSSGRGPVGLERRQSFGSGQMSQAQHSSQNNNATQTYSAPNRQDRSFEPMRESHSSAVPAPPPSRGEPELAGVHPSRLQQLGIDASARPPPLQTNVPPPYSSAPSPAAAAPPSGPRSGQSRPHPQDTLVSSPAQTSPTSVRGPPTGPSGAFERRNGTRRFAEVNETLQKGGQPQPANNVPPPGGVDRHNLNNNERGASIRGRAAASSRQNSFQVDGPNAIPLLQPSANNNGPPPDYDRRGPPPPPPQQQSQSTQIQSQVIPPERMEPQRRDLGRPGREDYERPPPREQREPRDAGRHRASREQSREHPGRGSDRETRSMRGAGDDGREREPRQTRARGPGTAPDRDRERDGGPSASSRRPRDGLTESHNMTRERDGSGGGGSSGRDRDRDGAGVGGAGDRDRERDRLRGGPSAGPPTDRDVRDHRSREHGRDDHGYHNRRQGATPDNMGGAGSGGGGGGIAGPHGGGGGGGRRDAGGDGRRMGLDARKRNWNGDEGGPGESKRLRRGGM